MLVRLFFFFTVFFTFESCIYNKLETTDLMRKNITYLEKNYSKMTKNEWKNNDKVFKKLIIQYDAEKEGFSIEEREKVNKLIGRYYAITTKRILFESTSSIEDLGQQIEGFIDELKIE